MYADYDQVKAHIKNKKSQTNNDEIAAVAAVVEPMIDAKLSADLDWPNDAAGAALNAPPPSLIIIAASYLVAAQIEKAAYAMNDSEDNDSKYGTWLAKEGWAIIDGLISGDMRLRDVVSGPAFPSKKADQQFFPTYGMRGHSRGTNSGRGFSRCR